MSSSNVDTTSLRIHDVTGVNVLVNGPRYIATRKEGFNGNAYVFSSRPVRSGEKISVQILDLDPSQQPHSLTFGMTSCNPNDIRPHQLPDDSDDLMDRGEYWIVCKDVISHLAKNDFLTFQLSDTGQITATRNGQPTSLSVHVDMSVVLWAFCDLSGNIKRIELKSIPAIKASTSNPSSLSSEVIFANLLMQGNLALQRAGIPTPFTSGTIRPSKPATASATCSSAAATGSSGSPQVTKRPKPPVPPRPQGSAKTAKTAGPSKSETAPDQSASNLKRDPVPDREECVVCMDNVPNCVLYTCGHMCMCYECAENLRKDVAPLCPVCRNKISDIIKVFR